MRYLALLALFVAATNAQTKYKLCATDEISEKTCSALQRGDSQVSCVRVADSADCAIKIERGDADFGIFDAEELLLAYQFYPNEIAPIYQLRHKDRKNEEFQFQSVAVVPADVGPLSHLTDFATLKNAGLCHPGFSDAQWWNDYILKYFERKVARAECRTDLTAAENEAENIRQFFGKSCRPGEWAAQSTFDATLKKKYPELCDLCDDPKTCSYSRKENHGHMGALDCLTSGRGKVAYVALAYVREYFKINTTYHFLCVDGSIQPLSTQNPCAWIKQPWGVIAAKKSVAAELTQSLKQWLTPTYASESWTVALNSILQEDSAAMPLSENTSTASYLSKGREIDLPNASTCNHNPIKWCTIGDLETAKCKWVSRAARALGIEPEIQCKNSTSTFQCFRDISSNNADIMTIDSNYGHLARTIYGLRTVLYSETQNELNSVVVAVTRNHNADNPSIQNFQSLKKQKACFPEYGGIAWLSFIYVARTSGIISSKSCDYPKLAAKLFSGACTPGIRDTDHSNRAESQRRKDVIDVLCSTCPASNATNFCAATAGNPYYGDRGAIECLKNADGDIAFIETRNLKDSNINPNDYRVLCKNGSLAGYPGFKVDDFCHLSETIDSEIVGRRNSSNVDVLDTTLALLKIENWLGYRVHVRRPISIYDKFNGTMDLLFKDSTSGLVNTSSTLQAVLAYKDLFRHVETCSSAISVIANFLQIALVVCSAILFTRVL